MLTTCPERDTDNFGSFTVSFCRRTWLTEVFDEVFAFGELLLIQLEHRADALQRKWQAHRRRPNHRAVPGGRINVLASRQPNKAREADPLEAGVERPLCHSLIGESGNNIGRDFFAAGKVNDLCSTAVQA
jgi:hypothetical protein